MIARLLIALIHLYRRVLSPLLGNVCRFEPSCSRYAEQCLALHGAGRGTLLSIVRLCKCHPFHPGGFDPPPLPSRSPPASTLTSDTAGAPTTASQASPRR